MLADILNIFCRDYFHYSYPITLSELRKYASDTKNIYYKEFSINKKSGGKRRISIPEERLKQIQNCIRILLRGINYRGSSITAYASKHIRKDVVYNIDIKNFYQSINFMQITSCLVKKGHNFDVAQMIASLVTIHNNEGLPVLPQGSPASPAVADMVVKNMDKRLGGFAHKHNIDITRYADDITFSCSESEPWYSYASKIKTIITSEGFETNNKKERYSFYYQRQEVLGITVNSRLNVTQKYIKQVRTILHNWEKDGYVKASNCFLMNYYKHITNPKSYIPKMERTIAGKISYIRMVRRIVEKKDNSNSCETEYLYKDTLTEKLWSRYKELMIRDHNLI